VWGIMLLCEWLRGTGTRACPSSKEFQFFQEKKSHYGNADHRFATSFIRFQSRKITSMRDYSVTFMTRLQTILLYPDCTLSGTKTFFKRMYPEFSSKAKNNRELPTSLPIYHITQRIAQSPGGVFSTVQDQLPVMSSYNESRARYHSVLLCR